MYDVIYIDADGEETPSRRSSTTATARASSRAGRPPSAAPAGRCCPGSTNLRDCVCVVPSPPLSSRRLRTTNVPAMRVGVIGGGLMGSGIAEVCARSGVDVTVVEVDEARLEQTHAKIDKSLDRAASSGRLEADDRSAAGERLAYSTSLEDLEGADAAIEAVVEDEQTKRELFLKLDEVLPDAEFLASNTSSVPIMKLAAGTSKPRARARDALLQPGAGAAAGRARALDHDLRADARTRAPVRRGDARQDVDRLPGPRRLRGQRAARPYILSAVRMYESGFAAKEDIDRGWSRAARTRWARSRSPT